MNYKQYRFGPAKTHVAIKTILIIIATFSLSLAILIPLIPKINLSYLFTLSLEGIKHGFIWQLISYIFILPTKEITGGFIVHLIFNLYLFWIISSSIIERYPVRDFLLLYFLSTLFIALISLFIMWIGFPFYQLGGNSLSVMVLLIAWMMLNPDAKLLLFFTIPIIAKYLVLGFLGFILLIDLSHLDLVSFFAYTAAAIFSYFFSVLIWQRHSPFLWFRRMENFIIHYLLEVKAKHLETKKKKDQTFHKVKIFDFKTGKPIINDKDFMEAMLTKISQHGEASLTRKERKRMDKISKKKR